MKAQIIDYIKSDLCRYVGRENLNIKSFLKHYLVNSGFKFSLWLRLCRSKNPIIRLIAKLQHHRFSKKYFLDIPYQCDIGYGLYLGHGGCVVINGNAKLGNNINLSHFVSIGSNNNQSAIIGDGTYIGPNVSLVEGIEIGKESIIGAGAVVTKDIPAYAIAVGTPAKVVKTSNDENPYVNNRFSVD